MSKSWVNDKLTAMSQLLTIKVSENDMPVECLSDDEALALSEMKFSDEQDATLSDLLARQRENQLDSDGRRQLNEMMRIYERGLLRKAQASRLAVERGLRER
jgi:hypothetical protein